MEIGVSAAGVFLKIAFSKLVNLVQENKKQLEGLDYGVQYIEREHHVIQTMLSDLGEGDIDDIWIPGLRRLGDDIQDCIDGFVAGKVTKSRFAREIAKLKMTSAEIVKQLERHRNVLRRDASTSNEEGPPAADGPMGLKDAEEKLLGLLAPVRQIPLDKEPKVIYIVGFGGQGKTRLAKKVYQDSYVCSQFPLRASVSVLCKGAEELLQEIDDQMLLSKKQAEQGADTSNNALSLPQIGDKGKAVLIDPDQILENGDVSTPNIDGAHARLLKTGRYLILVDDIEKKTLKCLLDILPSAYGEHGRIIVTTNITTAATRCNCGDGLPLALDITGQVVIAESNKTGFEKTWSELCAHTLARMQRSDCKILGDYLLYFCMFPRDHHVRRNALIRRWLAEGIVPQGDNTSILPQDVAAMNLEKLIACNILQPFQVKSDGKPKRCQPPWMLLDSLPLKSMSENFITMVCGQTNQPGYARRLSLHANSAAANGRLNLNLPKDSSRLHTLAVFPTADHANYGAKLKFAKCGLLRVLDLKECDGLEKTHLKKICDLVLLKYLSLGDSIGRIPRKIANLRQLETLDLRRTQVVKVPVEVIELPLLKHLLGKFQLLEGDLKEKKLQELSSKGDSILETLSGFVTVRNQGFLQLMSYMKRLRKVKIWCDPTADETNLTYVSEAIKEFVSEDLNMPHVNRALSIDFQGCSTECSKTVMDSLQAPSGLSSLKLCGSLTQLPDFNAQLNSIEELCLSWTKLSGNRILGGLSVFKLKLKYLKLVENNLGPLAIGPEHLQGLKGLCLVGVESLNGITISAEALPYLVSLHILCHTLDVLPGPRGIQITHLNRLEQVGLHSGISAEIKDGWQAATTRHSKSPNVLFIDPPKSRDRDSHLLGTNGTTANRTLSKKFLSCFRAS